MLSRYPNIVADMRKVLSKNPQVEQQKLHRRVFLENVNPENQALVQDEEKSYVSSSSVRPSLEENILLGVALEGSKRTLPIEEEMAPSAMSPDSQEFAVQRNGGGPPASKDKKDGQSSFLTVLVTLMVYTRKKFIAELLLHKEGSRFLTIRDCSIAEKRIIFFSSLPRFRNLISIRHQRISLFE
ncbi:hypothetical protein VNO80_18436 [Phaseolus coccineus]|uniref:Mechanosensitive ion channel protein 2/3 C-terminal domain-containing protein n=1 Tax=Phaseolus coccineus TaxID=3886 RepID=A0AAN9MHQ4_PHACN